ncbi:MAG: hypothetical protein ABI871_02660, partial [Chthoniobacterales bacterium]
SRQRWLVWPSLTRMPSSLIKPRVDPLARWALGLAVVIMIWPTQGDMVWSLLKNGRRIQAVFFAIICFLIVFGPFVLSCWRVARHRELRGKGYLIATGMIILLNVFVIGNALLHPRDPSQWHR